MYYSTKTYGNERGLSCCFRQWRADSHCSLLHGYSLGIKLTFAAKTLDDRNWVQDFGGLQQFESWMRLMFDHTLIIARNDPLVSDLLKLDSLNLARIQVVDDVGCEKFAELCFNKMKQLLGSNDRIKLKSVEVFEHNANSAIYEETLGECVICGDPTINKLRDGTFVCSPECLGG